MKPRIDSNPVSNIVRKEQHKQKLGDNAMCVLCGEMNTNALIVRNKSLLEKHHILGKNNDNNLFIVLCRNCHAKLTETQIDASVFVKDTNRSVIEVVADCIYALAVFLQDIIDTLINWSELLRSVVLFFDNTYPDWRVDIGDYNG